MKRFPSTITSRAPGCKPRLVGMKAPAAERPSTAKFGITSPAHIHRVRAASGLPQAATAPPRASHPDAALRDAQRELRCAPHLAPTVPCSVGSALRPRSLLAAERSVAHMSFSVVIVCILLFYAEASSGDCSEVWHSKFPASLGLLSKHPPLEQLKPCLQEA
jgi:hypothetical protein